MFRNKKIYNSGKERWLFEMMMTTMMMMMNTTNYLTITKIATTWTMMTKPKLPKEEGLK
jgi:hypothetical protein